MEEVWKEVIYYEDYYEVSNFGRVRSLDRYVNGRWGDTFIKGRVLKQITNKDGYKGVNLTKDGKYKYFLIHRIVAEAFIPNPNNYRCVIHKDGNVSNNWVENLEWSTDRDLQNKEALSKKRREKLSKKPILQYTKDGEFVAEWQNPYVVQKQTGINENCIRQCCRGRYKSAGGFIWMYKKSED